MSTRFRVLPSVIRATMSVFDFFDIYSRSSKRLHRTPSSGGSRTDMLKHMLTRRTFARFRASSCPLHAQLAESSLVEPPLHAGGWHHPAWRPRSRRRAAAKRVCLRPEPEEDRLSSKYLSVCRPHAGENACQEVPKEEKSLRSVRRAVAFAVPFTGERHSYVLVRNLGAW